VSTNGTVDLTRLIPGTIYDGHTVDNTNIVKQDTSLHTYSLTDENPVETILDVNLSGGAFYDTTHTYAPEELVPGTMYDNLAMTVVTALDAGNVAYSTKQ
jgi:hypothetical protein